MNELASLLGWLICTRLNYEFSRENMNSFKTVELISLKEMYCNLKKKNICGVVMSDLKTEVVPTSNLSS